jgi:hypothetical protein
LGFYARTYLCACGIFRRWLDAARCAGSAFSAHQPFPHAFQSSNPAQSLLNLSPIDRHRLGYLNVIEKANCVYCSYANGVVAYVRDRRPGHLERIVKSDD